MILKRVNSILFRFGRFGLADKKRTFVRCTSPLHGKGFKDDYIPPTIDEVKNPLRIIKADIEGLMQGRLDGAMDLIIVPREIDMAIIGGGLMGNMVAYALAKKTRGLIKIMIVERDEQIQKSATLRSFGGITHQFTNPLHIKLSLEFTKFIKRIDEELYLHDQENPDIGYNEQGYLITYSQERRATMKERALRQRKHEAPVEIMSADDISVKFPFVNTSDIVAGNYGYKGEGWFDPGRLLTRIKQVNQTLNVQYIPGDCVGFRKKANHWNTDMGRKLKYDVYDTDTISSKDGLKYPTRFAACIMCVGGESYDLAYKCGIGSASDEHGLLEVPLPVIPRKRNTYLLHAPDGPGLNMPVVVDESGLAVRREGLGGYYMCTMPTPLDPTLEKTRVNMKEETLEADYDFYHQVVKPILVKRIPSLQHAELKCGWACYEGYNTFDQSAVVGNHPYYNNMYFACGAGIHDAQLAYGIGKVTAENIVEGIYKEDMDVTDMHFDRFADGLKLPEDLHL